MRITLSALVLASLPAAACAQSPTPPQPPEPPQVSSVTEDCGEGCSRTTTTIQTAETGEDGHQVVSKNVEVIEIRSDGADDVRVHIDADSELDGDAIIRKKVKVITATDGEISPEMQAKIDAMVSELEAGDGVWHQSGDGIMVFDSDGDAKKTRVIIRSDSEDVLSADGDVDIDQVENADGSKTIRITPDDGGEVTVITIHKEKSSNSDN